LTGSNPLRGKLGARVKLLRPQLQLLTAHNKCRLWHMHTTQHQVSYRKAC